MIDLTDTSDVPLTNLVDWTVEHGRKSEVFNKWLDDEGVIMPKLQYPAYFEGGLVGVSATAPIKHRESFLAIPYKSTKNLLLTFLACLRNARKF